MFLKPVVPFDYSIEADQHWTVGAELGFAHSSGVRCVVMCIDGHKVGCRGSVGCDRFIWFCGNKGPAVTMGYAVDDASFAHVVLGGAPASVGDMRTLRLSGLWQQMETEHYDAEHPFIPHNRVVLGDAGYVLLDWLMVPMPESWLTKDPEVTPWTWRVYDFVHSSICQKVQHFNGPLYQLFGFARSIGRDRTAGQARTLARTAVGLSNFAAVMTLNQEDPPFAQTVRRRREEGAMRPAGPELEPCWARAGALGRAAPAFRSGEEGGGPAQPAQGRHGVREPCVAQAGGAGPAGPVPDGCPVRQRERRPGRRGAGRRAAVLRCEEGSWELGRLPAWVGQSGDRGVLCLVSGRGRAPVVSLEDIHPCKLHKCRQGLLKREQEGAVLGGSHFLLDP